MAGNKGTGGGLGFMEKCIIVAVSDNLAIGRGGVMPWHVSEDLKFFKRTTLGCPVIMGRTTFDSIGRPLPGRKNIVLSRNCGVSFPEGVVRVVSLQEAFEAAAPSQRCFVMGGASVYAQAISLVDRLFVTHIHTVVPDADTFFPEIDGRVWGEVSRSETLRDEKSGLDFEFVTYARR